MAQYDITIVRNRTFRLDLTWEDEDGNPISTVGYSARMQVRDARSGDLLLDLSSADSEILLGGASGTVNCRAGADQTAAIDAESAAGVYDLVLTLTANPTERIDLVEGEATIEDSVTE